MNYHCVCHRSSYDCNCQQQSSNESSPHSIDRSSISKMLMNTHLEAQQQQQETSIILQLNALSSNQYSFNNDSNNNNLINYKENHEPQHSDG